MALFLGLIIIILLPTLGLQFEGRLGQVVSIDFIYNHFMAIFGVDSAGLEGAASGVGQRIGWWLNIYEKWSVDLSTMLFGLGFGMPLMDFAIADGVVAREPHNSYISVLARTGIIGACFWLFIHYILLKIWRQLFIFTREMHYKKINSLLMLFMVYFVFIWMYAIGEDAFEKPYNSIPYYFFWGMILRMAWYKKKDRFQEIIGSDK